MLSLPVRRFMLLFVGGIAGVYAVLPHLNRHIGQFVVDVVLIGIAAAVGTYLASRTVLETPVFDAVLIGRPFLRRSIGWASQALVVGVVACLILIGLDRALFAPSDIRVPPLWTGLLYALAGGISEEVSLISPGSSCR